MLNKAFTGFVVVFWAVMMTMLIRVEYFPRETGLLTVPNTFVLQKIFHNTDPNNLDVIYRGARIGSFRLDVTPLGTSNTTELTEKNLRSAESYLIKGNLLMNMVVFGSPSRMHLRVESLFDRKYDMKNFDFQSEIGDARAELRGDNRTRQMELDYGFGSDRQTKRFSYDEMGSPKFLSSLGLPGLEGVSALGALGMSAPPGSSGKKSAPTFIVHTYFDTLTTPRGPQRVYLMEFIMNNSLNASAKMWVDEQGGIMLVDTSMGLTMRSENVVVDGSSVIDRTFERSSRK